MTRNIQSLDTKLSIPNEYVCLKYLESTGKQYINTKIQLFNNSLYSTWEIKAKYSFTKMYDYNTLWDTTIDENCYETWIYGHGSLYQRFNKSYTALQKMVIDTDYAYDTKFDGNKVVTTINDNVYEQTFTPTNFEGEFSMLGILNSKGMSKLYYFQLFGNEELLLYGIPCYRVSDEKTGYYDLVSRSFFPNNGTDNFLFGSKVRNIKRIIPDVN